MPSFLAVDPLAQTVTVEPLTTAGMAAAQSAARPPGGAAAHLPALSWLRVEFKSCGSHTGGPAQPYSAKTLCPGRAVHRCSSKLRGQQQHADQGDGGRSEDLQ
jgi:hypothetical protein